MSRGNSANNGFKERFSLNPNNAAQPLCVKDKKKDKNKSTNGSNPNNSDAQHCENPQSAHGRYIAVHKETISRLASQYTSCAGCSAAVKALLKRPLTELRLLNAVMEEDETGNTLRLREEYIQNPHKTTHLLETFPLEGIMKKVQPSGAGLRCVVHKRAPSTQGDWDWEDAWDRLPHDLRRRVATVEIPVLEAAMHRATAIHRFCADCKHNVITACDILSERVDLMDVENNDEFNPELYRPFEGKVQEVEGKLALECPLEDVEDLVAWYEDFDSKEYTSSGQRHAATLEHGQRELRAIVGSILLAQLRFTWHNHQAQVQAEQYLFCLVLHEIRAHLTPAATTQTVVEDLVWIDDKSAETEAQIAQASLKNKNKNKKKKERRKAKKAQASQPTDGSSNGDPGEVEELQHSFHSPSSSSFDGHTVIAPLVLERAPFDGLTQSCFDPNAEQRLLASFYEQLSDEQDEEDFVDEELMQEMEELRQQQKQQGATSEDRQALRTTLQMRFQQLVESSVPADTT